MLLCEECGGTSGELGKGCDAYASEDPDGIEDPCIIVYCLPYAAAEFGRLRLAWPGLGPTGGALGSSNVVPFVGLAVHLTEWLRTCLALRLVLRR
jgi:hypothetical protein